MAIRQFEESSQTCEKIQGEERDHHGRPRDQSRRETRKQSEKHSCTLCIGEHEAFLCPLALVDGRIATPSWAQQERKMARDDRWAPELRWYPKGVQPPPPPAAQPQAQPMDASDPAAQQDAGPEVTAPLCAAAVAMHGLPPSSSRSTFQSTSGRT